MVAFQQLFCGVVVELRVTSQKVIKRVQIALESDFLDHLHHFSANPRNLSEAHIVNLLRRHVGSGEVPREHRVDLFTAG